jgi:hypothetical protein
MEEIKSELLSIIYEYSKINENLSDLEKEVQQLLNKQTYLKEKLTQLRIKEKDLINKLEEKIGHSVNSETIFKILEKS